MLRLALLLFATNGNQYTPTVPGGIVAWIVCNGRKKHEFGGWLLFFYWQLYSGIIVTLMLFSANLQGYVPENYDNPLQYYAFLAAAVPTLVTFSLQLAVATMLISVRTWDLLRLLRWIIFVHVIVASIATAIDIKYFPDSLVFGIFFRLAPELLWLAYFLKSDRVKHVFKTHDWDIAVNTIYPETKLVT